MTTFPQVQDFLRKCNLLEYYDRFISEGFDQLQSLLDVTESDLIAMDVKRGHRRRLQREISTMKGFPPNAPLFIQHGSGLEDSSDGQIHNGIHHQQPLNVVPKILYVNESQNTNGTTIGSTQPRNRSTGEDDQPDQPDPGGVKRKYKRHPKRDKNAPTKPLSAYVMFAHRVREELSGQNISFPDMAKIVGDRWKNVSPEVKESIESEAAKKKEEYQAAMAVYKTTDDFKKYQEYLKEFREKHDSNGRDSSKRKRHKIDKSGNSPDSDNTTPSGYSSTRSTSVGYDNSGSGNVSSGSSNGNGNGHNIYVFSNNNYIPPYPHYNPNVPYGYKSNTDTNNNGAQNIGRTFLTPPSSVNTSTPSTILADLYAKDDNNNTGDDQSQPGNGSSSGSSRRPNFEDSDNSSPNSTSPAIFMENDDQQRNQQQRQSQDHRDTRQQENTTK